MAVVYRGMNEERGTGMPALTVPPGAKSLALAARVRKASDPANVRADLPADADGFVHPGTGGMSVNSTWADIPHFFVPARLQRVPPFRSGTAGDDCRIWSHPVERVPAVRDVCPFADQLALRMGGGNHGVIEPETRMHQATYMAALSATRPNWRVDEPAVRDEDDGGRR